MVDSYGCHGGESRPVAAEQHRFAGATELSSPNCGSVSSSYPSRVNRPYCPSRYAKGDETQTEICVTDALDRSAQLRSQIRALQQRRGQQAACATVGDNQFIAPSRKEELVEDADPAGDKELRSWSSWSPQPRDASKVSDSEDGALDVLTPEKPIIEASVMPLSMLHLQQKGRSQPTVQLSGRSREPQDKLTSILSFLDEVDESTRADTSSIVTSARSSRGPCDGGDARSMASTPMYNAPFHQQDTRLSLLEVEVRDKKSIIETLKRALAEARSQEKQVKQDVAKEWDDKLSQQKAHYEAGLERHLKLVDRLLTDKTELTKRCELFTEELKAVEKKFQMKMEELDEQATKETSRQKQNWMAAEKIRREAWEKDKVQEIKEMTIKGLQPEVERILSDRKQEKQKMEERHREATEALRREHMESADMQVRDAKEHLLKEQEHALDQERDAHRRKLREEFERFNSQMQEERARCAADVLTERRKSEQSQQQGVEAFEARLKDALAAERTAAEASVRELRESALVAEERWRTELEAGRKRHQLELEERQREHEARLSTELERNEAVLRQELTRDRDRQLDMVMERLSREQVEQQRLFKQESAALVEKIQAEGKEIAQRLGAQLNEALAQIAQLESQQTIQRQTAQDMQENLDKESRRAVDAEDQLRRLEVEKGCVETEVGSSIERHRDELRRLSEAHDGELARLHEEQGRLTASIADERKRADDQQAQAKNREAQIIEELEARVKRTLQAKDDAIAELRARCGASENKVREFEYLLTRQREELLGSLTKDLR